MAQLNKVFLMGNLTRDPELRRTANGTAVTDLGLAVNRSFNGKDGERREEVTYIDITVWDRQAETCCQYLKKGRAVHIEGSLKMDSWDDKTTGEKKYKLKVLADRVQFLGGKDDAGGTSVGADDEYAAPAPRRSLGEPRSMGNGSSAGGYSGNNSGPAPSPRRAPAPPPPADLDGDDDDIPF